MFYVLGLICTNITTSSFFIWACFYFHNSSKTLSSSRSNSCKFFISLSFTMVGIADISIFLPHLHIISFCISFYRNLIYLSVLGIVWIFMFHYCIPPLNHTYHYFFSNIIILFNWYKFLIIIPK